MRDKCSFRTRSQCSEGKVGSSLAYEAERIVKEAANPVPPGETVKGQRRRACRALGYPDGDWRIRAAWYGEADSWSAKAFDELRKRYAEWKAKQQSAALAEARKTETLVSAIANGVEGGAHEGLDRETVDRIRRLASRLGS